MWKFIGICLAGLLPLSGASASTGSTPMVGSVAFQRLGVAEYEVVDAGDARTEIVLLDQSGKKVGEVTVEGGRGLGIIAELTPMEAAGLRLVWDPERGIIQFSDLQTGMVGTSRYDLQAGAWETDEEFNRLATDRSDEVTVLSELLSHLERRHRARRKVLPSAGQCTPGTSSKGTAEGSLIGVREIGACSGPSCRGTGFGLARSLCCETAMERANLCCWNGHCTGCCRWLSCDAVCALGDYACSCGLTGYACSDPFVY